MQLATDEDRFEALLEDGEFDVAARHLVAQPTALLLESNPDGTQILAAISCPILKEVVSGKGQTEAAAILDAWTACLLAIKLMFGEDLAAHIETNTKKRLDALPLTSGVAPHLDSSAPLL